MDPYLTTRPSDLVGREVEAPHPPVAALGTTLSAEAT
jgi:hypothetical protein